MSLQGLTGESIKSAIAQKLVSQFVRTGFTPKFYKEKIVEGFIKPCFFIWLMDFSVEKQLRENYVFTYQMNIRYHAEDEKQKLYEHLSAIGLETVECLRTINVKTLDWDETEQEPTEVLKSIHGKQISFQVVDGILQTYVTYSLRAHIPENGTKMQTLIEDIDLI